MSDFIGTCERLWRYRDLWCLAVAYYEYGQRCGYVRVPETHPWHGLGYDDSVPQPRDRLNDPVDLDQISILGLFAQGEDHLRTMSGQVSVHGGVTFTAERGFNDLLENHDGIPDGWWVGFDAGHAGDAHDLDLIRDPYMKGVFTRLELNRGLRAWTVDDIATEVERLADQLHEVAVLTDLGVQMEAT